MGRVSITGMLEQKYLWAYGVPLLFVLLCWLGMGVATVGVAIVTWSKNPSS